MHVDQYTYIHMYIIHMSITGIYARFSQKAYTADESDDYAVIRVIVNGHRSSPISVNVTTFVSSTLKPKTGN